MAQQMRPATAVTSLTNEAAVGSGVFHAVRRQADSDATMEYVTIGRTHQQCNCNKKYFLWGPPRGYIRRADGSFELVRSSEIWSGFLSISIIKILKCYNFLHTFLILKKLRRLMILCCCLCGSVYPPDVARQRLGRNVTAVTNTHEKIEELLVASISMWPVSYQGK
jgi:hypothetical protein